MLRLHGEEAVDLASKEPDQCRDRHEDGGIRVKGDKTRVRRPHSGLPSGDFWMSRKMTKAVTKMVNCAFS